MSNYTLEDIEKFIKDYEATAVTKPNDVLISIPFVGRKIYQNALFESQKIEVFKKAYMQAKNGSIDEQIKFIDQMAPVLDDFYLDSENIVRKTR